MSIHPLLDEPVGRVEHLASSRLLEIARHWVPHLEKTSSTAKVSQRWYRRLEWNDTYEVWLLGWSGTQSTDLHDHGGSAGAVVLASGRLSESRFDPDSGSLQTTQLHVGDTINFDSDVIHDVRNGGLDVSSLSVHAYSPPLTRQTYYDVVAGQLMPRTQVEVEAPEPDSINLDSIDPGVLDPRSLGLDALGRGNSTTRPLGTATATATGERAWHNE